MTDAAIKIGDKVTFRPGPFATSDVTATVTSTTSGWLVTKDAAGKERKTRPGACRLT